MRQITLLAINRNDEDLIDGFICALMSLKLINRKEQRRCDNISLIYRSTLNSIDIYYPEYGKDS